MEYEYQKSQLIKKLTLLLVVTVIFAVLFTSTGAPITDCIVFGLVFGFVFYVPSRIKSILHCGLIWAIIITVIYYVILLVFLNGNFIFKIVAILMCLVPVADIGYSIYKVIKTKNERQ